MPGPKKSSQENNHISSDQEFPTNDDFLSKLIEQNNKDAFAKVSYNKQISVSLFELHAASRGKCILQGMKRKKIQIKVYLKKIKSFLINDGVENADLISFENLSQIDQTKAADSFGELLYKKKYIMPTIKTSSYAKKEILKTCIEATTLQQATELLGWGGGTLVNYLKRNYKFDQGEKIFITTKKRLRILLKMNGNQFSDRSELIAHCCDEFIKQYRNENSSIMKRKVKASQISDEKCEKVNPSSSKEQVTEPQIVENEWGVWQEQPLPEDFFAELEKGTPPDFFNPTEFTNVESWFEQDPKQISCITTTTVTTTTKTTTVNASVNPFAFFARQPNESLVERFNQLEANKSKSSTFNDTQLKSFGEIDSRLEQIAKRRQEIEEKIAQSLELFIKKCKKQ